MHNIHRFNLQGTHFAVCSNKILKPDCILLCDFKQGFYVYEFDHN